jgi:hypothetical protein
MILCGCSSIGSSASGISTGTSGFGTKERIGHLQIGSSEAEVAKVVRCPLKHERGYTSAMLADSGSALFESGSLKYNETWGNNDCGITVEMIGNARSASDTHASGPLQVKLSWFIPVTWAWPRKEASISAAPNKR